MPILNPKTPIQKILSCTNVDASITFAEAMGSIYVINTGTNDVWITLDGTAAVASDANGRTRILANGGSANLDDTSVAAIHGITSAGTSVLQIIAHPRPGNSGAGMG